MLSLMALRLKKHPCPAAVHRQIQLSIRVELLPVERVHINVVVLLISIVMLILYANKIFYVTHYLVAKLLLIVRKHIIRKMSESQIYADYWISQIYK
jgi:hypothetical protein